MSSINEKGLGDLFGEAEDYKIQEKYTKEHNIVPKTIIKDIRDAITNDIEEEKIEKKKYSKREINDMVSRLETEMREAASKLDFERATELRDIIFELKDLNS